jgi:hypothetical protein
MQLSGREAHDQVRAMLDETLDAGLWNALRLRQGTVLEQAQFAGGSLGKALDAAAGGEAADDREDDLWARITAERDRYWTATWHEKGDRSALQADLEAATFLVAQIEDSLSELQVDADEVARLVQSARALIERQRDQTEFEIELSEKFAAIERQRNQVDRLRSVRDTARADRDRAQEIGRSRSDQVERVSAVSAAVRELETISESAVPALEAAEGRLKEAAEATRDGRAKMTAAESALRQAVGDETYRRQQIELSQLIERFERVQAAIRRRSDAETVLEENSVDDDALTRVQEAFMEVTRADAAASAGASVVHLVARTQIDVRAGREVIALVSGEDHQVVVTDSADIDVPDVLHLTVTAGTEARSAAERVALAQSDFKEACTQAGVVDVAGAHFAAEARRDALRTLEAAGQTVAENLRDLSTEELEHKIMSLTDRIATYGVQRPEDPPLPADLDDAHDRAAKIDGKLQSLRVDLSHLEAAEADASNTLQSLQLGGAGTRANLEQARALAVRETATLDSAREGVSDEEITERLAGTEAEFAAAAAALEMGEEILEAEHPDAIEARLVTAREVLVRLSDDLREQDAKVRALRTKLEVKGDEGLAQQLDEAKSAVSRLTIQWDSLEARAEAARVLYETFAARRVEAHRRYVAPFRETIEGLARIVFGPTVEVELDDELRIARRTLGEVTIEFADLSTGAKEQLGMISRLACASIVADDGGAPGNL